MPVDATLDTATAQIAPQPRSRFGALAYREYRLLWSGLVISNTGSWMQYLAQGWLVVELAVNANQGALYLGLVGLVRAIPVLLLSGVAGALADRMDRRRILVVAQCVMGGSALVLGALTEFHVVRIWMVMIVAAFSSAGAAFDAPTRQSLVPLIVDKRDLMNAIGLNSAAFNGPAIIGPAIAGVLVASIGVVPCFYINAVSYVAVLVAVALMSPKPPVAGVHRPGIWHEMIAGVRYMRGSTPLMGIMVLSTLVAIVARPYIQLLPAFAKGVIGGGPGTLGILGSTAGAGALVGSIVTAFIGLKKHRGRVLIGAACLAGIALAIFASTRTELTSSFALILLGASIMLFMGMANTLLQTYTRIDMRGRVMALYTMTFLGLMPFGTWVLGSIASVSSLPIAFTIAGFSIVVVALAWGYRAVELRALD